MWGESPSTSLCLIHPFDDLAVMAGQGPSGLELLEQAPTIDTVLIPVGGGGLIFWHRRSGKAPASIRAGGGVEPEGADARVEAWSKARRFIWRGVDTIADGLALPFAGEHTFRHVKRFVDEMVRVTDRECQSSDH